MEEEKKFVNNLEYIKNGVGNKKSKDTYILNRPELNKWQCVKSIFCGSTNRHLFETRIKSEGG